MSFATKIFRNVPSRISTTTFPGFTLTASEDDDCVAEKRADAGTDAARVTWQTLPANKVFARKKQGGWVAAERGHAL